MKKKLFTSIAVALVCVLGLSPLAALADGDTGALSSSEEVIYSVLSPDGTPHDSYAVVILNVSRSGDVKHYGIYQDVKNLTDSSELGYKNGTVTAEADAGRFYYQGDFITVELPWNVDITYTLDGKEVSSDELPGAEGNLGITIKTSKNEAADPLFFDNFLLQVTVTLKTDRCENIVAEDASLANSGSDKLVTFTVMPGDEGNMALTADVTDFEMDGITISAVPFSASGSLDDLSNLTDGLNDMSDAVAQLSDGALRLSYGASDLSYGAGELKKGASSYGSGLTQAAKGSDDLVAASSKILAAISQLNGGLSGQSGSVDLSALAQLPAGLNQLADALDKISEGMAQLSGGFSSAKSAMASAIALIPEPSVSESDMAALITANPNNAALNALIKNYTAAQAVRATWLQTSASFTAVETTLPTLQSSVDTVTASLRSTATQIETAMKNSSSLSGLAALAQGMKSLSDNYSAFHTGLVTYTSGVKGLSNGWSDIQSGISDLSSGAYSLSRGAKKLSDGADTLNEETKGIPAEVNALVGSLGSSDFELHSFISDKNENTNSVQFVIKTDAIEKPAPVDTDTGDVATATLWDRIVALFTQD